MAVAVMPAGPNDTLTSVAERVAFALLSQLKSGEIRKIDLGVVEAACDRMKPISLLHREFLIDIAMRRVVELSVAGRWKQ